MGFLAIIGGIFLCTLIFSCVSAWLLVKWKQWSVTKKKIVFSLVAGFLSFPAPIPAALTLIPLPNVLVIIACIFDANFLQLIELYFRAWFMVLPSFLITAVFLRGIAAMAFYQKPLPADPLKQELS